MHVHTCACVQVVVCACMGLHTDALLHARVRACMCVHHCVCVCMRSYLRAAQTCMCVQIVNQDS